jgi:hypothetical protein
MVMYIKYSQTPTPPAIALHAGYVHQKIGSQWTMPREYLLPSSKNRMAKITYHMLCCHL